MMIHAFSKLADRANDISTCFPLCRCSLDINITEWSYLTYISRIEVVKQACDAWIYAFKDYKDKLDVSSPDRLLWNILTHSQWSSWSMDTRGSIMLCTFVMRIIQTDRSGNAAKWLAHNTEIILVLADLLSRTQCSYDPDGHKILTALFMLLVSVPELIPRYRAMGLKSLVACQLIDGTFPQGVLCSILLFDLNAILSWNASFLTSRFMAILPEPIILGIMDERRWALLRTRWNDGIWHEIRTHSPRISERVECGIMRLTFSESPSSQL